jgi:hypothetical protein
MFAALNARFRDRAGRTLLSISGIALGVALGFAVSLINRSAVEEMAAGTRSLAGEADLEVRGGRAGFPEALYPTLAQARRRCRSQARCSKSKRARGWKRRDPPGRDRCPARRADPACALCRRPGAPLRVC